MTRKIILAGIFVAVFAFAMIALPFVDANGHIFLKKSEIKVKTDYKKGKETLDGKITVNGMISQDGSQGAFGYGIITGEGPNNVLALATHAGVFDHPFQSSAADPIWHAHVLDLASLDQIMNPCDPTKHDAVVDFAKSVSDGNNIGALYDVKIKGMKSDKAEVKKAPTSDLNDAGTEAVVAFIIDGVGEDPNAPDVSPEPPIPWLCLDIVGTGVGL